MRKIGLAVTLLIFWLVLSAHYTPFLIGCGIATTLLVTWLAYRMQIIDEEGDPFELLIPALTYWPWLIWEIAKSAWSVSKTILSPSLPISPTMTDLTVTQQTNAGRATYANSITLTPGTVTTFVKDQKFTIHALVVDGADDLEAGAMNNRVNQFEGSA